MDVLNPQVSWPILFPVLSFTGLAEEMPTKFHQIEEDLPDPVGEVGTRWAPSRSGV